MNAKIYEVQSGAAVNYAPLLSPDKKHFYWNSAKFGGNQLGDVVFVVNRHNQEALYTKIAELGIQPTYDSRRDISRFNNLYNSYEAAGQWEEFIRFEVIERVSIPASWNWTQQLGQSETYILWQQGLKDPENRLGKVHDLQLLFASGAAAQELSNIAQFLGEGQEKASAPIDFEKLKQDPTIREIADAPQVWFEKAMKVFQAFKAHQKPVDFYHRILNDFIPTKGAKYVEFATNQYAAGSDEQAFAILMGKLAAYMDGNATNKNIWNETPDKRVFTSGIYMKDWIANFLRYKIAGNNYEHLTLGVRNALEYATLPLQGIPIVSEDHKTLIAEKLLNKPYNRQNFVADLQSLFNKHGLVAKVPENASALYTRILYHDAVRPWWNISISGLVAIDPNEGNWIQAAMAELEANNSVVLWWSKMPSGTQQTISRLEAKIQRDKTFDLFYAQDKKVRYHAVIHDVATKDNYHKKNWGEIDGIGWASKTFDGYADGKKSAHIAFLAESIQEVDPPIDLDAFEWQKPYKEPTRDNLQPFESCHFDMSNQHQPKEIVKFKEALDFNHEHARNLNAIQTKPFLLLAGISGTGKSRLVRTLAYQTCHLPELRHKDRPGNFELIPVLPNWHDSSELIGYESRLSGTLEYKITPFLRFLVKAHRFPSVPFFLCLDEMNLAPVEQYFAEFLSIIETRKYEGDEMVTDPFIGAADVVRYAAAMGEGFWNDLGIGQDHHLQDVFKAKGIQLAANLVVMGTVNMDETTHSFSRKVLDRAMTIEMNEVDLKKGIESEDQDLIYPDLYFHPNVVLGKLQGGKVAYDALGKTGELIIQKLQEINSILEGSPFKLAYRVRDELLVYCYYASLQHKKPKDWVIQCLDEFFDMKLLPRIEGDKTRCQKVLQDLLDYLNADEFSLCNKKLIVMMQKLENQGFTSYWD
jgi:hypothetical protein